MENFICLKLAVVKTMVGEGFTECGKSITVSIIWLLFLKKFDDNIKQILA
jgi:hypothetical protein